MREPWTRQDDETEDAFAAFALYRDLGAGERSITRVAQELDKSRVLIGRWSAKHYWPTRAAEYDRFLDQQRVDSTVQAIVEMNRRHAGLAVLMQQKVLERVSSLDPQTLSARDAARWIQIATTLERLSRGAATEITGMPSAEKATATLADIFEVPVELSAEERVRAARAIHERLSGEGPDPALVPTVPAADPVPAAPVEPDPVVPTRRRPPRGEEAKDAEYEWWMRRQGRR